MPTGIDELKALLGYDPSDNTSFIDRTGVDYGRMLEVLHNGDAVRHISNSILGQFADIAEESIRDFTFIKVESEKEIERRQKEMQEAKEREKKRLAEEMEKINREREEIARAMELLAREREADDARTLAEQEAAKKKREETARKRAATRAANAAAAAAASAAPIIPAPLPIAAPVPLPTPAIAAAPPAIVATEAAAATTATAATLPVVVKYQKIDQLTSRLTNHKQIEILNRVKLRHPDDQMYFINFERNTSADPKKRSLVGTFLVLGTLNKHGERSQYHVDLYDPAVIDADKKSFYCNCPAHKFQGARDNTVCKHISFIMCRVVGYMTEEFFKTLRLTKAETDMIVEKVSVQREVLMMHIEANRAKDSAGMLETKSAGSVATSYDPSKWITRESFKNSTRDMAEEACPICFDDIVDGNGRLNCPECKKHIHKDCIEVWLSRHDSCVYCRSTKWKHYRKCFIENGKVAL